MAASRKLQSLETNKYSKLFNNTTPPQQDGFTIRNLFAEYLVECTSYKFILPEALKLFFVLWVTEKFGKQFFFKKIVTCKSDAVKNNQKG